MNKATFAIMMTVAVALSGFYARASLNAHEGRAVYHSECEISENPVRYEGFSGKVAVRKWWYRDTVSHDKIVATKAQHEACESVKVLMSSEAEVAEADRLKSVENQWLFIVLGWFAFVGVVDVALNFLAKRRERLNEEEADRELELEWEREQERRIVKQKTLEAERQRSKTANEERARRKAERGAILEARRLANLERKKG